MHPGLAGTGSLNTVAQTRICFSMLGLKSDVQACPSPAQGVFAPGAQEKPWGCDNSSQHQPGRNRPVPSSLAETRDFATWKYACMHGERHGEHLRHGVEHAKRTCRMISQSKVSNCHQ